MCDTEKARHTQKQQRNKLNPDSLVHVLNDGEHYDLFSAQIQNDLLRYIRV